MTRRGDVAWLAAWSDGLRIALEHRKLVAVAALAGAFEGAFGIWRSQMSLTWMEFGALLEDAIVSALQHPLGGYSALADADGLAAALLFAAFCFLFGAALLVGLLGLLRDLLVRRGYCLTDLTARTRELFWPVFWFKFPVYLLLGATVVLVAAPVWAHRESAAFETLAVASAVIFSIAFGIARVFLSLGAKVLAAEGVRGNKAIYRRVVALISPHLGEVTKFHLATLVTVVLTVGAVTAICGRLTDSAVQLGVGFLIVGFVTVVTKAATFRFYLQLASCQPQTLRKVESSSEIPAFEGHRGVLNRGVGAREVRRRG